MKFHDCVRNIIIQPGLNDKVWPVNEAWWRYIWVTLERLHNEDYEYVWR